MSTRKADLTQFDALIEECRYYITEGDNARRALSKAIATIHERHAIPEAQLVRMTGLSRTTVRKAIGK